MFIGMYKNNDSKHNNIEALCFILLCLIIMFTVILKGGGEGENKSLVYIHLCLLIYI